MGAERDVVKFGRHVAGAGLGPHGRDADLLGDLVDRDIDAAVDEAEDHNRLLVGYEAPIGCNTGLVLAGAVLDRKHYFTAQHAAIPVEVFDRDFAAALDLLAERSLARRR